MSFIQQQAGRFQSSGGKYKSDIWGAVTLSRGDRIWGGYPHETEYFTDWETISEFGQQGYTAAIWDALQVANHKGTFRGFLVEYRVLADVTVPAGRCTNNQTHGNGGAFQYLIREWRLVLEATGEKISFGDASGSYAPAL
jgi:hypothetical protein